MVSPSGIYFKISTKSIHFLFSFHSSLFTCCLTTSRQTAIYRAIYKKRSVLIWFAARIVCIYIGVSLQSHVFWYQVQFSVGNTVCVLQIRPCVPARFQKTFILTNNLSPTLNLITTYGDSDIKIVKFANGYRSILPLWLWIFYWQHRMYGVY